MVKTDEQQTAMKAKQTKQSNEQKLRELALHDPVMHQMFGAYHAGRYSSWEDFLTDAIIVMSSVKEALHERLIEESLQRVQPPFILISTDKQ